MRALARLTNSTPRSLLFAQQPLTHERSSSPKPTLRPPAQPSSPHLRAGLCQSSPLPSEGTRIPTGVFLLPIQPGDRVVAVCILIITILNGVGRAGAVCGRSRSWGCYTWSPPKDARSSKPASPGRADASQDISALVSPQLQPLPITPFQVKLEQTTPCNDSAAGWEGSRTGAMPAGAAMFPSPGRAVLPTERCLLCQAGGCSRKLVGHPHPPDTPAWSRTHYGR